MDDSQQNHVENSSQANTGKGQKIIASTEESMQRAMINFLAFVVFSGIHAVSHFSKGKISAGIFLPLSSFLNYFLFEAADIARESFLRQDMAYLFEGFAYALTLVMILAGIASFWYRPLIGFCAAAVYFDTLLLILFLLFNFNRLLSIGVIPFILFLAFHLWLCYFMSESLLKNAAAKRQIRDDLLQKN